MYNYVKHKTGAFLWVVEINGMMCSRANCIGLPDFDWPCRNFPRSDQYEGLIGWVVTFP
jgi:hypothetical protein